MLKAGHLSLLVEVLSGCLSRTPSQVSWVCPLNRTPEDAEICLVEIQRRRGGLCPWAGEVLNSNSFTFQGTEARFNPSFALFKIWNQFSQHPGKLASFSLSLAKNLHSQRQRKQCFAG